MRNRILALGVLLLGISFSLLSDGVPPHESKGIPSHEFVPKSAVPHEAVQEILAAKIPDNMKARALRKYLHLGMDREAMDRTIGPWYSCMGHGPGFTSVSYGDWFGPGIRVGYYPDGEPYRIVYSPGLTKSEIVVESHEFPVSWPKNQTGSRKSN